VVRINGVWMPNAPDNVHPLREQDAKEAEMKERLS
jgi:hypothetical protein